MLLNKLLHARDLMRKSMAQDRSIIHNKNVLGFSSLYKCSKYFQLKQLYPELDTAEANAIDDGLLFEHSWKDAITQAFSDAVVLHEPTIPIEVEGHVLEGHPDFVIEFEDRVIVLEFKAPVLIQHRLPQGYKLHKSEMLLDIDDYFIVSENYTQQAATQQLAVQTFFNKPTYQYLFLKGVTQIEGKNKKLYILKPVEGKPFDVLSKEVAEFFGEFKGPKYSYECSNCNFKKAKVCDYKLPRNRTTSGGKLSEDTLQLYTEYQESKINSEALLARLKKLEGAVRMPDRNLVGWIPKETKYVNLKEAYIDLGDELFKYLEVSPNKKEELLNAIHNKSIIRKQTRKEFLI